MRHEAESCLDSKDTPEPMDAFFDARADIYNEHMLSGDGEDNYFHLGRTIPKTDEPLRILDIGCGSGIELNYIWARAPNAHVTCVDISRGLLTLLRENHAGRLDQITVVEASHLDWDYPAEAFDIVVSSQTMHHFFPEQKLGVYRVIRKALKPGGIYVESDFYVDAARAEQYRRQYDAHMSQLPERTQAGQYHIDIPRTIDEQIRLLSDAGFRIVEVVEAHIRAEWSGGTLRAVK